MESELPVHTGVRQGRREEIREEKEERWNQVEVTDGLRGEHPKLGCTNLRLFENHRCSYTRQ